MFVFYWLAFLKYNTSSQLPIIITGLRESEKAGFYPRKTLISLN